MQTKLWKLKRRLKSMSRESRELREDMRKLSPGKYRSAMQSLHDGENRQALRHAFLAYGFLRGRTYGRIEQSARTEPDWEQVERIAMKFGVCPDKGESYHVYEVREATERLKLDTWLSAAKMYFDLRPSVDELRDDAVEEIEGLLEPAQVSTA